MLQLAFNRFPEHSPGHRVVIVGVTPTRELPNWKFREFYTQGGEVVGRIPGTQSLEEPVTFQIDDVLRMLELSPVNRIVWFRIEKETPGAGDVNTIAGYSVVLTDHGIRFHFKD